MWRLWKVDHTRAPIVNYVKMLKTMLLLELSEFKLDVSEVY